MTARHLVLAAAFAAPLMGGPAWAKTISVTGEVAAVTIDAAGGAVTRRAEVDLSPGDHSLRIEGLPTGVDPDSLRVRLLEGAAEIDRVALSQLDGVRVQADRRADLTAQVEALEAAETDARNAAEAAEIELNGIRALSDKVPDLVEPDAAWDDLGERLYAAAGQALARRSEARGRERELQARIAELDAEIRSIGGAPGESRVEVDLATAQDGAVVLALSYRVRASSWQPVYDVRLDVAGREALIERRARVRQSTGSDWQDVDLTLSTQRPHGRTSVSLPGTWWIDFEPEGADGMAFSLDRARKQSGGRLVAESARAPSASLGGTPFAVTYEVDSPVDVPSGGAGQLVDLGANTGSVDLETRVVPAADPTAYLAGTLVNRAAAPLMSGRAALYRDGAYVGRIRMPQTDPGGEAELAFGRDPRIEVARRQIADEGGESGIRYLNGRKTRERAWLTTLTNLSEAPVVVRIVERLPVAGHEDIEVALLDEVPLPTERNLDDRRGVLAWDVTVPASGRSRLPFGYSVSWPEDKALPDM